MPATGSQPVTAVQAVLSCLHESSDSSVYDAVERLVQAGDAVGLDADTLVRMLDRGMTFVELLELIEARMECLQKGSHPTEAGELPWQILGVTV
jgi:hypothetical protein